MIANCPRCHSIMDCSERGEANPDPHGWGDPCKVVLLECPGCLEPILGISVIHQSVKGDYFWGPAERLWPEPEADVDDTIPALAANPLREALKCYAGQAYDACAVMCGRTIEGVCRHYDQKARSLKTGLKSLRASNVIDQRLYEWGEALRKHRNLGAHASPNSVSMEEARYLLDFTVAFCQYVFVLNAKWDRFQKSRGKSNNSLQPTPREPPAADLRG